MTDSYIEVIKNQFFSQENMNFIMQIVTNKHINTSHQILFNASNQIFNNFIHTIYTQKKHVNPNKIEDLLITLNKMVIDVIVDTNKNIDTLRINQNNNQDNNENINKANGNNYTIEDSVTDGITNGITNGVTDCVIEETHPKKSFQNSQILKETKESLYIFSEDCDYNDGIYKLRFNQKNVNSIELKSFELLNDLYNITEYNNKVEITDKTIKKNISIPIGCYNLIELLETMEKCIIEKFKDSKITMKYNKNKNRIYINNDYPFTVHFIENDSMFIPLRFMLGFDKKEYMNNNNYCSNKEPGLNIYDNIYIKILTLEELNKHTCKDFNFFERLSFNHIDTFSNIVKLQNFDNTIHNMDIDNLSIEFYYRHMTHRKFYRINNQLKFTMIFNIFKQY